MSVANTKNRRLCCVNTHADPLTQASKGLSLGSAKNILHCSRLLDPLMGRAYLNERAPEIGAVEPPPWRGRGTGGGLKLLLRTRRSCGGCEILIMNREKKQTKRKYVCFANMAINVMDENVLTHLFAKQAKRYTVEVNLLITCSPITF